MKKYLEIVTNIKYWLIIGSIGVWVIVLQNFGVFGKKTQKVYVTGGDIDADVRGYVSVDNTVDVNIEAVNGYRNAFYGPSYDGTYDAIHVYTGK
jgi:hypothetical protein